ncbi:hypothetical protein TGAM01_v204638 [Trichoderma gamsii]|uniref:Uncharacterized protein n=1 Tax=Trichoderma gamsii TaxID=398673 RepID=A0A2P4ZQQ5_9HYPO|nr:hypothetical protein TGAM01_v204638 [Trichoderma gamsii]PON26628.1 hypothetical protein TGAM01_v204638 [Trichoderma gamsii]
MQHTPRAGLQAMSRANSLSVYSCTYQTLVSSYPEAMGGKNLGDLIRHACKRS